MRYFTEKPPFYSSVFSSVYACDHPLYDKCTLFSFNDRGLAVIQQHFTSEKVTYWAELDDWLPDAIFMHDGFNAYFDSVADFAYNGLYPTLTVRQLMWAIRMKPLPKLFWETQFDHRIANPRELQAVI